MSVRRKLLVGRRLSNGQWLSVLPVTREEFAEFIRSQRYCDVRHWHDIYVAKLQVMAGGDGPRLLETHGAGADEVLRRIDYRWDERCRSVRGVNWYEADAYCRGLDGRLPTLDEWKEVMDVESPQPPAPAASPPNVPLTPTPWNLLRGVLRRKTSAGMDPVALPEAALELVPQEVVELARKEYQPEDSATWTRGGVLREASLVEWCSGAVEGAGRPAVGLTQTTLAPEQTTQMGFRVVFPTHVVRSEVADQWAEI